MDLIIIQKKIFEIRGQRIMFDFHLAELYEVETRALVQAVKRNLKRFPPRYMFQLTKEELINWKSQIVMSKREIMGLRKLPYVFTEHGITMLSAVLRSDTAVKVSIAIVDAFILLNQYQNDYKALEQRIDELEKKFGKKIENITDVIQYLLHPPAPPQPEHKVVGYKLKKE